MFSGKSLRMRGDRKLCSSCAAYRLTRTAFIRPGSRGRAALLLMRKIVKPRTPKQIIFVNEREKQVRDFAFASRDPKPASLRARARGLRPLADRREPAARSRRARAGALQFSVHRACAGCGDSCLRPKQFRATNFVRLCEARGHFSRK